MQKAYHGGRTRAWQNSKPEHPLHHQSEMQLSPADRARRLRSRALRARAVQAGGVSVVDEIGHTLALLGLGGIEAIQDDRWPTPRRAGCGRKHCSSSSQAVRPPATTAGY
jgi:hypothetical protein